MPTTSATTGANQDPGPRCRRCGELLRSYGGTGDTCEDCQVRKNSAAWRQDVIAAGRRRIAGTGRRPGN
jgi:hypothetical protein